MISKIKNYEILKLKKELDEYNETIKDILIQETEKQGFITNQIVMLKEGVRNVCLTQWKKYFIKDKEVIFNQPICEFVKNSSYEPYVHLKLGRIKPDGFTFSTNIIDNDNFKQPLPEGSGFFDIN